MDIDEKEKNVLNLEKEDFEKMDDHQRIHCVGIILLSMAKRNEVLSNIITSFDPIEQKMIIRDYFTPLFENFNKLSTFFKKFHDHVVETQESIHKETPPPHVH